MENPLGETSEEFCQKYGKSLEEINLVYESAPLDATDIIDKLAHPNWYPKGFYRASLFLGDPGVGKTTLAIAIGLKARELAGWFFEFFIHSDFDGSERNATGINLKNKLQAIVDRREKTLVVIDELHRLLENSGDKHYDTANTSSTLWTFLDHHTTNENFFFIGCMNEAINMADPMKDRMCTNSIMLPKPTPEMKRRVFRSKLTNALTILHNDCNNDAFIDELLLQLEGWSGRNIEGFTYKAFDLARRDDKNSDIITINAQHFEAARQYIDNKRKVEFKCGTKEVSEAERLQKESFAHSDDLNDKNIAQQTWLQLKLKSLDRSVQGNGGINGGMSFGLNVGANIGFNVGGGGTRYIVLDSDYEEIKEGLTNNQIRHLDIILAEARVRIVTQAQIQQNRQPVQAAQPQVAQQNQQAQVGQPNQVQQNQPQQNGQPQPQVAQQNQGAQAVQPNQAQQNAQQGQAQANNQQGQQNPPQQNRQYQPPLFCSDSWEDISARGIAIGATVGGFTGGPLGAVVGGVGGIAATGAGMLIGTGINKAQENCIIQ